MRIKVGISFVMVLLVVISSCAVNTVNADEEIICPPLTVAKTVRYGEQWVNDIDAYYGDIVEFKIVVDYYNYSNCLTNVVITDTLPSGLEYIETISVEPDEYDFGESGGTLVWDFGDMLICKQGSIIIRFTALVIEGNYGENINTANVTGTEPCGINELSAEDDAIVNIRPSVVVEKTVWDPDAQEWVEYLDGVIKDVDVEFQIIITYHGSGYITCLEVIDEFEGCCDCLEYLEGSDEFTYPNNDDFDDPNVTIDGNEITWLWSSGLGIEFLLGDGQSVTIHFKANVTHYCYPERDYCNTVVNNVDVDAWNCESCEPLEDSDQAEVNCRPHDPVFEKTVLYKDEWVDEGYTYKYEEIQFKIELTYYGDYNLTDIVITDYLPEDILKYVGPSSLVAPMTIPIEWGVTIEDDGKTITWNSSVALNDSETLTIMFKAEVIGSNGDCEECGINLAEYAAVESCTAYEYGGEDTAQVHAGEPIGININIRKRLHIGRISAYIKSSHDDFEDVDWTIKVTGGVFKRVNVLASGTIDLPEDAPKKVSLPWKSRIVRRGGRVTITVTATLVGGETIEKRFDGIVLGRIILVRPLVKIFG